MLDIDIEELKINARKFRKFYLHIKSKNHTQKAIANYLNIKPPALSILVRYIIPSILEARSKVEVEQAISKRNISKDKLRNLSKMVQSIEGFAVAYGVNINEDPATITLSHTIDSPINGTWITSFQSEGKDVIEIYYFDVISNKVTFKYQHYKSGSRQSFIHGEGIGYLVFNKISLIYLSFGSNLTGSILLRIEDETQGETILRGNFFELWKDKTRSAESGEITLKKIDLPKIVIEQLQQNQKSCFADYNGARKYLTIEKDNLPSVQIILSGSLSENIALDMLLSIESFEQHIERFNLIGDDVRVEFAKEEQQKRIDKLCIYLKHKPNLIDEMLVTYFQLKLNFEYYGKDIGSTLDFIKKVFPAATLIYDFIETEESLIALNFKLYYFRSGFSLGKLERDKYVPVLNNVSQQIELLKNRQRISTTQYHNFLQKTLGYACSFDANYLDVYQDLSEDWQGDSDPANYLKINARQCRICNHIRNEELDEVEQWIEEIEEIRQADEKEQTGNYARFYGKYAYYYLVKGVYLFKKGENDYLKAKDILLKAVNIFDNIYGGNIAILEAGYAHYVLYKMDRKEYIHYKLALFHLEKCIKRNYCLFDYATVLSDLKKFQFQ